MSAYIPPSLRKKTRSQRLKPQRKPTRRSSYMPNYRRNRKHHKTFNRSPTEPQLAVQTKPKYIPPKAGKAPKPAGAWGVKFTERDQNKKTRKIVKIVAGDPPTKKKDTTLIVLVNFDWGSFYLIEEPNVHMSKVEDDIKKELASYNIDTTIRLITNQTTYWHQNIGPSISNKDYTLGDYLKLYDQNPYDVKFDACTDMDYNDII